MAGPYTATQGTCTLVVQRTGDNQPYTVGWAFRAATPLVADLDAIAAVIGPAAKLNLSLSDTLTVIQWRYKNTDGGDVLLHESAMGTVGSLSTANTPQNVAFLLQKRAGTGGRHGRGRCFWPCVQEADVGETGVVTAGAQTRLQTMCTSFLSAMRSTNTASSEMLILPAAPGPEQRVVTFKPDTIAATQRRRLRR